MNWIKANKFLTGFIAVMLIGIGVLGYLLYTASASYDSAEETYTSKANEYSRLRHLQLYPDQENLKKLEAQKTEAADMVSAFQAQLATRQFPVKEMSPAEFQDQLKAAVTEIGTKASAANLGLPAKFYLGFDPYESQPPKAEAVGVLARQLSAIKWVMERMIENHITTLVSLTRTPLSEEGATATPRGRAQPAAMERNTRELVIKNPLDIQLVSRSDRFGHFLDAVVGPSAPQFYIPRVVRVKNQNPKGPAKTAQELPAAAAPPIAAAAPPIAAPNTPGAAPAPGATPAPDAVPAANSAIPTGYIVGEELIKADLRLEIVEFVAPKTRAGKGAK